MSGWIACCGNNSGGSSSGITFDLSLYRYGYQYGEDMELARGVGGDGITNAYETIMSFVSSGDITVTIAPFCLQTNTGGNEGYFELSVNGVQEYRQMLPTSTWTNIINMPDIQLHDNDILELRVGFINTHNGCNFYYRQYNPNT